MLDKLLALAKLEHKRQLTQLEKISVSTLIQAVLVDCQLKLAENDIAIVSHDDDSLSVNGEHFLLHQALFNLLDNAIDFSAAHSQIKINAAIKQGMVEISIQDAGVGIPDFAMPRLFERFYSLQRPKGDKSTGLGLAFVKQVADLHHGQVVLKNVSPTGVCATLILPMA